MSEKDKKELFNATNWLYKALVDRCKNPTGYVLDPLLLVRALINSYKRIDILQADDDKVKKQIKDLTNKFVVHNYVERKNENEND